MKTLLCSLLTFLSLNPCLEKKEENVITQEVIITTSTTSPKKIEKKLKSTKEIAKDLELAGESVLYFCTFESLGESEESILDVVYTERIINGQNYLLERVIDLEMESSFSKLQKFQTKNNLLAEEIFLVRNSFGNSIGLAYKKEEGGLKIRNFKSIDKNIISSFCSDEF